MTEEKKKNAGTAKDKAKDKGGAKAGKANKAAGAGDGAAKKSHRTRNIVIGIVVAVAVLLGAGIGAYGYGVITPASAAARYGAFKYLDEQDVTDYIMTYKEQMGYGEATDDEWAEFLATYNLTPERLRLSTVYQLLSDITVEQTCADMGITVSDEEIDTIVDNLKTMYGIVDDDVWEDTLELYGQSEEALREAYTLELLKQKLCTQEVEMPTPTDEEILTYIESIVAEYQYEQASEAETTEEYEAIMSEDGEMVVRHSYRFVYDIAGDEATLEESNQVELIKEEFEQSGLDLDTFVVILGMYCNDSDCIESNGAMGWDIDTDEYSEIYLTELENTATGSVSNVFTDGDTVCFIWVDQEYALSYSQDELASLDLSEMPSSLYEYFSDCEAYELWDEASDDYLNDLVNNLSVTIYEMPSDVPYNVDMSDYLVEEDDVEDTDADTDADADAEAEGTDDDADASGSTDGDAEDADAES